MLFLGVPFLVGYAICHSIPLFLLRHTPFFLCLLWRQGRVVKIIRSVNMPIFMREKSKISERMENTYIFGSHIFPGPVDANQRLPERALLIASKEKYLFMFPFPTFLFHFSQPGENVWAGLEEEERRERVEAIKSNHGHRSETERGGERSEGPFTWHWIRQIVWSIFSALLCSTYIQQSTLSLRGFGVTSPLKFCFVIY